ncbi:MAG TPA: hypothetical protein VJ225_05695 [Nitrososphaeraceae archaeon]|nr:hypothetical protein [Nitrososphaeraceae archaeon]
MKTNSTFGLGAIVVFSMVAVAAVALSIVTTPNALLRIQQQVQIKQLILNK